MSVAGWGRADRQGGTSGLGGGRIKEAEKCAGHARGERRGRGAWGRYRQQRQAVQRA